MVSIINNQSNQFRVKTNRIIKIKDKTSYRMKFKMFTKNNLMIGHKVNTKRIKDIEKQEAFMLNNLQMKDFNPNYKNQLLTFFQKLKTYIWTYKG